MVLVDWFLGVLASFGLLKKEAKILFLGLDNAGKNKVLSILKNEHMLQDDVSCWLLANRQPMQNPVLSEEFSIGQVNFKAFDFGGHQIRRRVLEDYNAKVDAVVYLVNVSDTAPFWGESKDELTALLSDESLATVPFLILGHNHNIYRDPFYSIVEDYAKWKKSGVRHRDEYIEDDLRSYMGLDGSTTGKGKVNLGGDVRPLEIFGCSIFNGVHYDVAFNWLSQYIKYRR